MQRSNVTEVSVAAQCSQRKSQWEHSMLLWRCRGHGKDNGSHSFFLMVCCSKTFEAVFPLTESSKYDWKPISPLLLFSTWFLKWNKQQMLSRISHPLLLLKLYQEHLVIKNDVWPLNLWCIIAKVVTEKENILPMKLGTICFHGSEDSDEQPWQIAWELLAAQCGSDDLHTT